MKRSGLKKSCNNRVLRRLFKGLAVVTVLGLQSTNPPTAAASDPQIWQASSNALQLAQARDDTSNIFNTKPARPKIEDTEAQRELEHEKEALSEPLETTVKEGGILGGLLGGGFSIGFGSKKSAGVAVPTGILLGSLAGKYVAAKQKKYSEELEVIEAITKDVQEKNAHAESAIGAMRTVVEEDRKRLGELRQALEKGEAEEEDLEDMVEVAERDLKTMQVAATKTEEHLDTFVKARSIVIDDSDDAELAGRDEIKAMDVELDGLRNRIRAMHDLVAELSDVS